MHRAAAYIRTVLAIFKRDMKRLGRNPIALIVVIGVCILPALYAWYTVAAFWDPYQNTESIEVAVVNEDRGAEDPLGGRIDVGAEVVDDLKDNHQLGWQFVSRDEAMEGVESGRYYGAVIMPEDFSEGFVSVFSGRFDKPQIDFYVNEKLTGSGVKVAETGAADLEKEINRQFVDTVSENVMEITQRAGLTVEEKTDESQGSLTRGVDEAVAALQSTRQLLADMGPSLEQTGKTLADAQETLTSLQAGMPELETTLTQAEDALDQARTALSTAANGASTDLAGASVALSGAEAAAQTAAGRTLGQVQQVQGAANAAATDAQAVIDATDQALASLRSQAQQLPDGAQVQTALSDLESANARAKETLAALQAAGRGLDASAQDVGAATQQLDQTARDGLTALGNGAALLQTQVVPKLDASLASAADVLGRLRGVAVALGPTIDQSVKALEGLQDAAAQTQTICAQSDQALAGMESQLAGTLADLNALRTSAGMEKLASYLGADPADMASFMASPVTLDTVAVYPVKNYGSGVAPFFTNLALWVSGFILMAMVRLRVDPEGLPKFTARQAYFGRWLTYAVLGVAQGLVCGVGDVLLGIQCESPTAFVGACVLTGFAYVNLMYALAYSMRHVGKAIAVILLVVQIPGSSGMFPVSMLPGFYQAIHPFLPFTYSIDAMRQAIGGFYGMQYLTDMLALGLVLVPVGFAIGLGVGKYGYNLNILFDRKLQETDLFVAEQTDGLKPKFRLRTMVRALMDSHEFRAWIRRRAKRFERVYPWLARAGWAALFGVPVLMMVTLSLFKGDPDAKLLMLAAFFALMVVVAVCLTVLSFLDSDIKYQTALADKDADRLRTELHASHGPHAAAALGEAPSANTADDAVDADGAGSPNAAGNTGKPNVAGNTVDSNDAAADKHGPTPPGGDGS